MRPTIEQIRELPRTFGRTFPPEFEDPNGHVNVRHYLEIHAEALDALFVEIGIDPFESGRSHAFFATEHHIRYFAECAVGDEVSAHVRLLSMSEKVLHGMSLLVNDTRSELTNTLEFALVHVDLQTRRSAPWDSDLNAVLEARLARDASVDWPAPVIERGMGASR